MLTVFSIYKYVRNKLDKTKEGTAAYDVLWDVYHFIRINMNSSYGMMGDEMSIPEKDLKKLTEEMKNENIH
jgi:hypothetical protein